jgi:hypothetical protein
VIRSSWDLLKTFVDGHGESLVGVNSGIDRITAIVPTLRIVLEMIINIMAEDWADIRPS